MKKLFIGIAVTLVALIGAILIIPSFIDWNDYKPEITAQAKKATGRDLSIDGDIRIAILPAPALVANQVRFANAKGAADAEMATLKSVEVRISLQPLLRGQIQVETVKLIDPVISLEVLADGKKNWEFQAPDSPAAVAAKPGPEGQAGTQSTASTVSSLSLDNFEIQNGTIVYRDRQKNQTERVENINARIAAGSMSGPFELSGSLRARGVPLKIDASLGRIIEGRTASFNANLQLTGTAAKIQATGALVNLSEAPQLKAKIEGEGASLARVVQALAAGGPLPGFLGQPFRLEGDVVTSAQASSVTGLKIGLGDAEMTGTVDVSSDAKTKATNLAATLGVNRVDLDKWLALPPVKPAQEKKDGKQSWHILGRPAHAAQAVQVAQAAEPAAPATPAGSFTIPTDLHASLNLTMDALIYRGDIIHRAKANAELNNGEITVSQVSAQLPGTTDVALFGFLSTKGGTPRFEGQVEAAASDVRGVARWLGTTLPDLPSDRFRRVTVAGKFAATPQKVDVTGLDVQFDSSRLTGALTVALRDPLAFGANFVLDRLNLDAYLPPESESKPAQKAAPEAGKADKSAAAKPQAAQSSPQANREQASPLAALGFLKSFDANVKAHVRSLVYRKMPVKDIVFDGTLFNNTLEIRRASVDKYAGASANVTGKLENLVGLPVMKNVQLSFSADNLNTLFRAVGVETPEAARKIGKIVITGSANGSPLKPAVDARVQAAGADVTAKGTVTVLPVIGVVDLVLNAKHGDVARLLRTLNVDYRPSGRLGALDLAAAVKGNAEALALNGIKLKIGGMTADGAASVNLKGPRPKISVSLTTGPLTIDPFLPAQRTAALDSRFAQDPTPPLSGGFRHAAWRAPESADRLRSLLHRAAKKSPKPSGGERWSPDPIDLGALQAFDGDIALKAPSVTFDKLRLDKADIAMTLVNGVVKTQRLTGELYGGPLNGDITLDTTKSINADAALTIKNADVSRFEKALSSGKANLDVTLNSSGASVAQMVSRLAGKGSLVLEGLDVHSKGAGSALAPILGLVTGLNQLGGQLPGSKGGKGLADITGTFTIEQGVARSQDLKLLSGVGSGEATGTVDLPKWFIDVNGKMDLSQNVLTQLLTKKQNALTTLPFRVYGRLDAPNVKLDTSKLKGGLPVPGLDKVIKEKPGVGKLLEQVFPGVVPPQQQQQQQQPQQEQQPQQQQKKVRPEDVLKDLFKIR